MYQNKKQHSIKTDKSLRQTVLKYSVQRIEMLTVDLGKRKSA